MTPGKFLDCEQGSHMWQELRCGLVTASRCADVIATTKKGESAARAKYRTELLCEILTGQPYPQYVSQEMIWGQDQEPFARAAYELETEVMVETVGFVLHPVIPRFGASPDGLVGSEGLMQIKCPTTSTHLSWLLSGTIPVEHCPQMLAELSCTGRAWCDFVSFDPRLPAGLQLFIRRFERDEKLIAALEAEVLHFNAELQQVLKALPGSPQPVVKMLDWPEESQF